MCECLIAVCVARLGLCRALIDFDNGWEQRLSISLNFSWRKPDDSQCQSDASQTFLYAFFMLICYRLERLVSALMLRMLFFLLLLFELPTELTIRSYSVTKLDKDKRDRAHQET